MDTDQSEQENLKSNLVTKKVQTEKDDRYYVPPIVLSHYTSPSNQYASHEIVMMLGIFAIIFVCNRIVVQDYNETTYLRNLKFATGFGIFAVMAYAAQYFPNSFLYRPHPVIWRMVHGAGLFWFAIVIFACFFNREDLQKFLHSIDPVLGKPLKERSYAVDCRIFTPENPESYFYNVKQSLDIFITAHFIGWIVKMLIVRNFFMVMTQSVLFELMEITFRHWLPNFYECWWDHIILDIFGCNLLGILVGKWLIEKYKMRTHDWSLKHEGEKDKGFWYNIKGLFFAKSLIEHQWKVFSSTKRFLAVVYFIFMSQILDLSYFFNKYVLWLDVANTICVMRTFIIGFLCIPATADFYQYIANSNCKRLGPYAWNINAIIFAESLLFINNYNGQFKNPFPTHVIVIWSVIGAIFLMIVCYLLYHDIKRKKQEKLLKSKKMQNKMN